ncbi:MAG: VCBS repeat-containing protein [Gemmatimonadetes bacterium]|nr:VCBS repeat-containing protein [Gemmatimonadota bacterium]
MNRINAPAAIYRNHARTLNANGYLTVELRGAKGNTSGIGARVTLKEQGTTQVLEQNLTRGFESSVDPRLHFGVGSSKQIDSLIVVWPDRRTQVMTGVAVNRLLTLWQDSARFGRQATGDGRRVKSAVDQSPVASRQSSSFTDITTHLDIDVRHKENDFLDYSREPLMPHRLSTEGPALAVGDVNGDGLDDIYVGGGKWQPGTLLVQQKGGTFLTVAEPGINGSCVVPEDFDGDGDIDLFVGSRDVAGKYGVTPRSHLLRNDGKGQFTDVTDEIAPGLAEAGMVTSAAWVSGAGTKALDLIVVGEWMPVRVFRQENGRFVDRTAEVGLAKTEGWWNSVTSADLDGDGRTDLVLGNLGLNSFLTASPNEPTRLYVSDFAQNGTLQQILTSYKHGVSYPVAGRDELVRPIPSLRSKFPTYASFGASRVEDLFTAAELSQATVREARVFATSVALAQADGTYKLQPLPVEAQFSPVFASVVHDFDGDGHPDLLLVGNLYGVQPVLGRYDASAGTLLRGLGGGRFTSADRSDLGIEGEVRDMKLVRLAGGGSVIAVARNNATLLILRPEP